MLLDFVKVFVYKYWSFELTAKLVPTNFRKNELIRRQGRAIIQSRIAVNFAKVRKQAKVIYAVRCFEAALKKHAKGGAAVAGDVTVKPKQSGDSTLLGKS
jgi:hypothetical protein